MKNALPLQNRDIIIVGLQPWDTEIGSNCKNIAVEMSRHNRVLYVNSPLDRISIARGKNDEKIQTRLQVISGKKQGLQQIDTNFWQYYPDTIIESINWIKVTPIFSFFNKINNRRIAKSIQKAIKQLAFKNYILFNDNDIFRSFYLKDFLQPAVSVYYSRDYLLAVDYWKTHGYKLEPAIIAKSDVCVANSTHLTNYCGQYNKNSFYVGQGCDLSIYKQVASKIPDDLLPIPKPIIGYTGYITALRLDIKLLVAIAKKQPTWQLVFVGPEDADFASSELHSLANVHFLGAKEPETLPAYVNQFNVCINPQILNEVTIGNYPRKVDEYLALGKPVVATETEGMVIFKDYVYLGTGVDAYIQLIENALAENDTNAAMVEERKALAFSHTWENSVQEIYNAIKVVEQ